MATYGEIVPKSGIDDSLLVQVLMKQSMHVSYVQMYASLRFKLYSSDSMLVNEQKGKTKFHKTCLHTIAFISTEQRIKSLKVKVLLLLFQVRRVGLSSYQIFTVLPVKNFYQFTGKFEW